MECGWGHGREAEQALSHRTAPSLRTSSGGAWSSPAVGSQIGPVVRTQEEEGNHGMYRKLPAGIAVSAGASIADDS